VLRSLSKAIAALAALNDASMANDDLDEMRPDEFGELAKYFHLYYGRYQRFYSNDGGIELRL
ncbi:unnamed protein product, partial [Acidithrix sp. C25]